jgi:hypothetical protein
MDIKNPHLRYYKDNGCWNISGYTLGEHFYILDHLEILPLNKKGGVAEIGVHHGQFYIMLNRLVTEGKSYAIDVFEDQHLNIDLSGEGSKIAFEENLRKYDLHSGKNTVIIQGDSTDPSLKLIETIGVGTMRYVSIDGGHTAEHTINDLKIANEVVSNEGVVILDDILHPCWMGVLEGAIKFLENKPTLVPFAVGKNKMYFCKLSYYQHYLDHMMNFFGKNSSSPRSFFGHKIVPLFI